MSLLLAEELLLLSLDEETGRCVLPRDAVADAVASALIFELTLRSTLKQSGTKLRRDSMVTSRDELLAATAERSDGLEVAEANRALVGAGTLDVLVDRLVATGALASPDVWAPGPHWPTGPRADGPARARLEEVLVRGAEPTEREAVLVSLLVQLDLTPRVLPHADHAAVHARATEVAGSARPLRNRRATTTPGSLGWQFLDMVTTPFRWLR
ncbi:GPP34 family phosphoprotein [Ornithinimicrobium murale]|uniref:GPP34 family phosphoprotein n=1 Tax=Ornithinimicrobium murale TaxID=1050153 RepID=UPI000E0D4974|nr:GPP34 family phosphoprotein [Ornithinimicrobium murale]